VQTRLRRPGRRSGNGGGQAWPRVLLATSESSTATTGCVGLVPRQYSVRAKTLTSASPPGTLQAMRGGFRTDAGVRAARVTRTDLLLETLALRHQLGILARSHRRFRSTDRLLTPEALFGLGVALWWLGDMQGTARTRVKRPGKLDVASPRMTLLSLSRPRSCQHGSNDSLDRTESGERWQDWVQDLLTALAGIVTVHSGRSDRDLSPKPGVCLARLSACVFWRAARRCSIGSGGSPA
jgi:hypothetical protein